MSTGNATEHTPAPITLHQAMHTNCPTKIPMVPPNYPSQNRENSENLKPKTTKLQILKLTNNR